MPTLTVTVGERDRIDKRTRRRIKAAQRGEELDDSQPVLNFGSYAELGRLLIGSVVSHFRIDRTRACGRPGKQFQPTL
jgi:predicted transcriptional regulator